MGKAKPFTNKVLVFFTDIPDWIRFAFFLVFVIPVLLRYFSSIIAPETADRVVAGGICLASIVMTISASSRAYVLFGKQTRFWISSICSFLVVLVALCVIGRISAFPLWNQPLPSNLTPENLTSYWDSYDAHNASLGSIIAITVLPYTTSLIHYAIIRRPYVKAIKQAGKETIDTSKY
jgi:hypothetical protein